MEKVFEKYVKNYDMNDKEINYKYHHSYRVAKFSDMISQNMSKEDKKLAHIIGLYHDIGRFEQDKLFNSFYDVKTFDHGDYGAKILIEDGLIKEIPIEEKYYKIIEKAVKNHNKYEIEKGLTEKELLHAKIIRDADKLDIITTKSNGIALQSDINLNDEKFSVRDSIKENFYQNKTIKRTKENINKTTSEIIVFYLALIFDLNFDISKKYLLENKILDNLYNRLKNKDKYKEYFDYIKDYLEKR